MVALYFTVVPGSVENFRKQVEQWEKEAEGEERQHLKELEKYVKSLKKAELQEQLLSLLIEKEDGNRRKILCLREIIGHLGDNIENDLLSCSQL